MKIDLKRCVLALFAVALLSVLATGCETAHGFGKDMENAGDSIQRNTQ